MKNTTIIFFVTIISVQPPIKKALSQTSLSSAQMKEKNAYRKGILLALVGSLLFSTKAVFVKLAYQYDVDSISLLLLRMVFALPFYLFMILRLYPSKKEAWRKTEVKYWLSMIVAALLGYYLSSLLDFTGLQYIDASVERLILFIYPTFIAIFSYLFLHEKLTSLQVFALLLSYVGLFFVFGQNLSVLSLDSAFWKGAMLIFLCAITFAIFLVMSQWLIPQFGVTSFTSLCMAMACVFVIGHYAFVHEFSAIFKFERPVYLYALAMGLVATVIPSYVVNYAIQHIGATRAAIVSSVGPISTVSLAYWLLGERLSLGQISGALLIIAGVTVVSVEMRRRKSTAQANKK